MKKIYDVLEDLRPEFNFHEASNFIEEGMLDSFDIVALVTELEEEFSIKIDGLDIIPDNFVSVESILNLIKKNGGKI